MKVSQIITTVGGIILAGLGGMLLLTNPDQTAYEEYATKELTGYLKDSGCKQIQVPHNLGNVAQSYCKSLIDTGRPQLKQLIADKTERQNFILFSIYRTELSIAAPLPGYSFETIGALQKFYTYEAEEL